MHQRNAQLKKSGEEFMVLKVVFQLLLFFFFLGSQEQYVNATFP